jgi:hypothetical protein
MTKRACRGDEADEVIQNALGIESDELANYRFTRSVASGPRTADAAIVDGARVHLLHQLDRRYFTAPQGLVFI